MRCGRQGLNPAALPDTPNPSGSHKRAVSPVTVWTEPFRGREGSSRDQEQRPSARFFCPPQALPFPSWPGRGHDTVQFQSGKGTWRGGIHSLPHGPSFVAKTMEMSECTVQGPWVGGVCQLP